jgi:thiol-disulfide isomerase/thioredoxin/protocatechuate 3,4-dioxygenase beta subunit
MISRGVLTAVASFALAHIVFAVTGADGSATLKGRVLLNGKPVPNVTVQAITWHSNNGEPSAAQTGADGTFEIHPGAGRLSLGVDTGALSKDWIAKSYQDLYVKPGGELDGLDFVLEHGVLLHGQVLTREGGRPVANASIQVSPDHGTTTWATTDRSGRYFARVSDGQTFVAVRMISRRPINGDYSAWANIDAGHNPPVEIRIPDQATMPPIAHLAGLVSDASGAPLPGAEVRDLIGRQTAITDGNGRFRFEKAASAGDLVIAAKDGRMSSKGVVIGEKDEIKLTVDSSQAVLSGVVVGDDGKPLEGVQVTIGGNYKKAFLLGGRTVTDSAGRYRLENLYGGVDEFYLWFKKPGLGSATVQPIRISPGEAKELAVLKMEPADGTIDGRVVEADGTPAKHVNVSSQTQESDTVQTDDEGRFHLTNVPRGQHWLAAGRGNSFFATAQGTTGQTDVLIKLPAPSKPTAAGFILGDRSGQKAPDIKLAGFAGANSIDLTALKGKVVVVDLWAVWCHPCVESLPQVEALYEKYRDKGVVVIGIHTPGTPMDKITAFVKDHGLTYPIGLDAPDRTGFGASAAGFGPDGIPHVIVISKEGRILYDGHEIDDAQRVVETALGG